MFLLTLPMLLLFCLIPDCRPPEKEWLAPLLLSAPLPWWAFSLSAWWSLQKFSARPLASQMW